MYDITLLAHYEAALMQIAGDENIDPVVREIARNALTGKVDPFNLMENVCKQQ